MTSEQLLATRATLWRQKGEPLLTLEDAQAWLQQSGLCLFLPRKAQIPAPAPSFVEACLGETNPTPPRTAIETARELVVRLIESGSALPLNLLGTPSDHPDFLVSQEALPFVYALRGDRDWKRAPETAGANRVSPLITHVWQLLERRGVLTAAEIQEDLGKELTEAAVLRALHELWGSLRVIPLYQGNRQETLWEPLQSRHQKTMTSGVAMSQVTALSVLASVYLQSVVAAGSDDAESFLSPLASRSKVREVVRGLTATRQLSLIQMETQSLLYVEGSLPEFPEADKPAQVEGEAVVKPLRRPHPTSPAGVQASLARKVAGASSRPPYKRPSAASEGSSRPPARSGGGSFRPAAGVRPDSRKREAGFRASTTGARPAFRPKPSPVERSEPGTGLRPDGTPKKTRWRDLPGGRPDQKGKPARFGPRKSDETAGEESAPRREAGTYRPAAGAKPPYKRASAVGKGKSFRPAGSGRPASGFRPAGKTSRPPSTGEGRSGFRGTTSRPFSADRGATDRGAPNRDRADRPSSRPPYSRSSTPGGRPPSRPGDSRGGSRPPSRPGSKPYAVSPQAGSSFSGPRRSGEAPTGDRKFTPRPARASGGSFTRPRTAESRPYTPRSRPQSDLGRPKRAPGKRQSPAASQSRYMDG